MAPVNPFPLADAHALGVPSTASKSLHVTADQPEECKQILPSTAIMISEIQVTQKIQSRDSTSRLPRRLIWHPKAKGNSSQVFPPIRAAHHHRDCWPPDPGKPLLARSRSLIALPQKATGERHQAINKAQYQPIREPLNNVTEEKLPPEGKLEQRRARNATIIQTEFALFSSGTIGGLPRSSKNVINRDQDPSRPAHSTEMQKVLRPFADEKPW